MSFKSSNKCQGIKVLKSHVDTGETSPCSKFKPVQIPQTRGKRWERQMRRRLSIRSRLISLAVVGLAVGSLCLFILCYFSIVLLSSNERYSDDRSKENLYAQAGYSLSSVILVGVHYYGWFKLTPFKCSNFAWRKLVT